VLQGCSAAEVFDFFQLLGLATHRYRHHCLAALPADKPARAICMMALMVVP
jgi:hypothetical protein